MMYFKKALAMILSAVMLVTVIPVSAYAADSNEGNCDSLCVRRGNVYYFSETIHAAEADRTVAYGKADDTVLFGDWDGDGMDTYCVRRGNAYYFKNSLEGGEADYVISYGKTNDEVLVGDWDGDGTDTLAVRRGAVYYIKNSIEEGNADQEVIYGKADDTTLSGDWDGDGKDTLTVRRGREYNIANSIHSGNADQVVAYGKPSDDVLTGDWDGDSTDTLAVRRGAQYFIANSFHAGDADSVVVYGKDTDEVYAGCWAKLDSTDITNPDPEPDPITVWIMIDGTKVTSYNTDGKSYLMVPNTESDDPFEISFQDDIASVSTGTLDPIRHTVTVPSTQNETIEMTDNNGETYTVVVMQSDLPSLMISLNGTTLNEINSGSKDTKYEGNHVDITGSDAYDLSADDVEVKGRGNSSWTFAKKPYQIKFDSKTSILGMTKAKKWVLLANHDDASLMRNTVSFEMADSMGMYGTSEWAYVDLWVDGEYLGNYLVCEKVDISSASVDLQNKDGVLVELDNAWYEDEDVWSYSEMSNSYFVLKEHNADDDTAGEEAFDSFCRNVDEFESILYEDEKDWDKISSYIDEESFAKYYLIQELAEDFDGMISSTYMYWDGEGDEIHMGPIWDMGMALGNQTSQDVSAPWITNPSGRGQYMNTWYRELLQIPEFYDLVVEIYENEARDAFISASESTQPIAGQIQASADMNFIRWDILGKKNVNSVGMTNQSTFEENVNSIRQWIDDRMVYLDDYLFNQ